MWVTVVALHDHSLTEDTLTDAQFTISVKTLVVFEVQRGLEEMFCRGSVILASVA